MSLSQGKRKILLMGVLGRPDLMYLLELLQRQGWVTGTKRSFASSGKAFVLWANVPHDKLADLTRTILDCRARLDGAGGFVSGWDPMTKRPVEWAVIARRPKRTLPREEDLPGAGEMTFTT